MTRLCLVAVLLLTGCAEVLPYVPAMVQVLDIVADLAKVQSGQELEDLRWTCEHEYTPANGEIDILCTVYTR